MKKRVAILGFIAFFAGSFLTANGEDLLYSAKKENLLPDSIVFDSLTYSKFKGERFFNYYETKIEKSFFQSLFEQFNNWLNRSMNKTLQREEFDRMLWVIGILLIIALLVILYFQKPGIFYFNKKNDLVYSVDYEDIVNQDFDSLTEQSVNEKKYADAIRWQYLKTLKILHEAELISYDMYKTVNEYVYEIKNTDLRKLFKNLSREFVYYRYGKGEADASRFNRFKLESEEIKKILNR